MGPFVGGDGFVFVILKCCQTFFFWFSVGGSRSVMDVVVHKLGD